MPYIAIVNFDYTGRTDANTRNLLAQSLEELGWEYVETSAFTIATDDYILIAQGIELIGRSADAVGNLSALSIVVQYIEPGLNAPGARRATPVRTLAGQNPSRLP